MGKNNKKVRHVLGISGGKDSAALAIYLNNNYPDLNIEYYFCDTGKELQETLDLVNRIENYLGKEIKRLKATNNSHFEPFDYYLKSVGNFLPSVQSRWCTQKLKLEPFEKFIGNDLAISYVGIRGDEDREGYISTKPHIQSIFPFRKNIWSLEILSNFFKNENIDLHLNLYQSIADKAIYTRSKDVLEMPRDNKFTLSKKLNALLDINASTFNKVVFTFLKDKTHPISYLDNFSLLNHEDNLNRDDIFKLLRESGVGVPAYYEKVPFTVDGQIGEYARSRSGCYFCFFQQRIEWIWLYEQHQDLFKKATEYEKDGYTWIQGERLEDLVKPERIRQIKLDAIKRREKKSTIRKSPYLMDMLIDAENIVCANCFI
jgi:3'-phosphoadenosine 5'-phosphosulfate sulfotransferase (PAPS reductase)/FAD synthetase